MIDAAISFCPNDTFLFDAWIHEKIATRLKIEPSFHDIQHLNTLAYAQKASLIKISAFAFAKCIDNYTLLPVGAAIGCFGPKLVAKRAFEQSMRIGVAGFDTTSYLLLRTLLPEAKEYVSIPYHEIIQCILDERIDAGLIIHETRFSFMQHGLIELYDLGELFYKKFSLPVPLGVVVAHRNVPNKQEIIDCMRQSYLFAKHNPSSSKAFMQHLSQEKEMDVIVAHVEAYVTDETYQISFCGMQALKMLFTLGCEHGLLPWESLHFYDDFCLCNA